MECIDPEFKRLRENATNFSLYNDIAQATGGMKSATRDIKRILKNKIPKDAYKVSCNKGVQYLYPPLLEAWEDLQKLMEKML